MSYTDLNESITATFTALQAALAQQSDAVLHEIGCAATQGQTERRDWLTEKARKLRIVEDLVFQAVQGYVEFAHGETPRTPLAPKNIEPIPQTDDRRVVPHRKSPRKGLDVRFGGKHYHGRATRVFTDVLRDIGIEQVKGLRRRVGEHELVTMEPTPKNENHYPGQKQVVWVSIQRAVSLIILVSMLAGPPVRGQVKADKRSRIQQSEVRRTDLQDHLKGYSLIERARGKKVRIELRDGTILSGRVRRIVHAENTSTLFLRMRGMKAPEPVPVDRIETISYRGSVSKGGDGWGDPCYACWLVWWSEHDASRRLPILWFLRCSTRAGACDAHKKAARSDTRSSMTQFAFAVVHNRGRSYQPTTPPPPSRRCSVSRYILAGLERRSTLNMQTPKLGEIIAVRVLHRTVNGGAPNDVVVRLGKPESTPDGKAYATPFEIDGLDSLIAQSAFGVDAVQSLQLAFQMIGANLDFHRQQPGVELYFELPGDDLRFPETTG